MKKRNLIIKLGVTLLSTLGLGVAVLTNTSQVNAGTEKMETTLQLKNFYQWFQDQACKANQTYLPDYLSNEIEKIYYYDHSYDNRYGLTENDVLGERNYELFCIRKCLENNVNESKKGVPYKYVCMTSALQVADQMKKLGCQDYYILDCENFGFDNLPKYSHFVVLYQDQGQWFVADLCFGTATTASLDVNLDHDLNQELTYDQKQEIIKQKYTENIKKYLRIPLLDFMKKVAQGGKIGSKMTYPIKCFVCYNPHESGQIKTHNIFEVVDDPEILEFLKAGHFFKITDENPESKLISNLERSIID